jgi:hypothetical protein
MSVRDFLAKANCLGVMSPVTGLNATFASAMARPGIVASAGRSTPEPVEVLDERQIEALGTERSRTLIIGGSAFLMAHRRSYSILWQVSQSWLIFFPSCVLWLSS